MTRSTLPTLLAFALLGAAVSACAPAVAVRGNMTTPERVGQIKAGVATRPDVEKTLGPPTSVATFDPNVWYYIGQVTEKSSFQMPTVVERRVVIVRFDDEGVVREIKSRDNDFGQDVETVDRQTPTYGREMGFLEQMLGNLGRFSAKDAKGKGPGG